MRIERKLSVVTLWLRRKTGMKAELCLPNIAEMPMEKEEKEKCAVVLYCFTFILFEIKRNVILCNFNCSNFFYVMSSPASLHKRAIKMCWRHFAATVNTCTELYEFCTWTKNETESSSFDLFQKDQKRFWKIQRYIEINSIFLISHAYEDVWGGFMSFF